MIEWNTNYCRYEDVDDAGQVKVTTLDYLVEQTVDEVTGSRQGRVDLSEENRVFPLPALLNVPASVMTGWIQDALGPEMVAQLEEDAMPGIEDETIDPPTGGFDPNEDS